MDFRITGLAPAPFSFLFGLDDAALASHGAKRYIADKPHGFPDRIELRDAAVGESLILLNYVHQPADTPYRASHAIFVREGASAAYDAIGQIPACLLSRCISLRAFDDAHMMVDGAAVDGSELEQVIVRMLSDERVAYLQAHYASRGCYAARIERG
jgi:hypothetical protein